MREERGWFFHFPSREDVSTVFSRLSSDGRGAVDRSLSRAPIDAPIARASRQGGRAVTRTRDAVERDRTRWERA